MPSLIDPKDIVPLPAVNAIGDGTLAVEPDTVLERPCPFCGKPLRRLAYRLGAFGTVLSREYERCTCDRADEVQAVFKAQYEAEEQARRDAEKTERIRQRIERAYKNAGMPERWKRHTFGNFDLTGLDPQSVHSAKRAKRYAEFIANALKEHDLTYSPNGLYFFGACGTGKTHLAAAVLNHIIGNTVTPVLAATMQELAAKLKQTYDTDEDEERIIQAYTEVPVLLIDDLGSEQPTEWTADRIFRVVNGRYNANLPTIVTSNYEPLALGKRLTPRRYADSGNYTDGAKIADRLLEMCVVCPLTGESKRGNRHNNA